MYGQLFEILSDIVSFHPITDGIILLVIAICVKMFYRLAGAKK